MRHLGFIIAFFGLLELLSAAPDRAKRQTGSSLQASCQEIFNVSCDSLPTSNDSEFPALSRVTTPVVDTSDGECVQYYQCNRNGTFNTDGETIIDRRISPCPGILEVFCKSSLIVPGTIITTPNPPGPVTSGTPVDPYVTEPTPIVTPRPTPMPTPRPTIRPIPIKPGCGHRNPGGISVRITGNNENEAQFGEFPWMVAVLERASRPGAPSQYTCGGSLIHPRVILTAAHTVEKKAPSNLIVRAGEWDTQTILEPIQHQEREVVNVILHENFNTKNLHQDFALLMLKTPFELAPNVGPICLPNESDNFDAARCTATGWGKDKFEESGKFQAVLKRIVLPVVPSTPCQTFLRLTRLGKAFILDPSFICAGGEPGLDTCTGDGGSPLACPLANTVDRYVQAGIVAWGINCGSDRTPGVYANVAKARKWIDSKMAQYNLDISSYTV